MARARRVGVIPDLHIPFNDPEHTNAALEGTAGCDHIVLLGDVIDAYPLSSFNKNPARKETLQDELDAAEAFLDELRSRNPKADIDFLEGNHEDRLRRLLWSKAPELSSLRNLTIPKLLNLDERKINYHGRAGFRQYGHRFKHGDIVRNKAGYTARNEMDAHRLGGFSGHTHRMAPAVVTDKEGRETTWWECGHLCRTDAAEYVTSPDWQAGYLILHVIDEEIEVEPVMLT